MLRLPCQTFNTHMVLRSAGMGVGQGMLCTFHSRGVHSLNLLSVCNDHCTPLFYVLSLSLNTHTACLKSRMKAVILSGTPSCRAGITNHLSVSEDIERPGVKADQVLVRVKATALNIEDITIGAGE